MPVGEPPPRPDLVGADRLERPRRRDRRALFGAIAIGLASVVAVAVAMGAVPGVDSPTRPAISSHGSPPASSPTPALGSKSSGYTFLSTRYGGPARWNPCEPIRYVVNPEFAPPGSMRTLRRAIERVEKPTGLRFRFAGFTDERPSENRPQVQRARYGPGWAPVLVAWVPAEGEAGFFTRRGRKLGVTLPRLWPAKDVDMEAIVTAQVVLSSNHRQRPGFAQPNASGLVMMHELGHVVGMGHVKAYGAVMDPTGGGALRWGPGELEGLGQLGRDAGCFDTPRPPSVRGVGLPEYRL